MMALTPGQGPVTVGEDTATVADSQGAALGGGDDPAGPPDVQGLAGGAAQDRGEPVHGRPQPPLDLALVSGGWSDLDTRPGGGGLLLVVAAGAGVVAGVVVVGVVAVAGVAGDHHPGHRPVTSQPPTRLGAQWPGPAALPSDRPGAAEEAVEVHDHRQLGSDPAGLGQLTCLQGAPGELGEGVGAALGATALILGVGWSGQGVQGGQQGLAGLGLQQPLQGDHALPGRGHPHPALLVASLGLAVSTLGVDGIAQVSDDPPQPGWVQAAGRLEQGWFGLGGGVGGQVVGAGGQHRGVGHRELAVGHSGGGGGKGPRNNARAVRTQPWAALAPMCSRLRSQLAVEAAWMPWSAPAAPRPSTAARRWSHWPSRRSTSRRNPRACSARAASASPSRSWAASPSTTSASGPSPCGNLSEHLFESMAATYQAPTPRQAPNQICGQVSGLVVGLHARLLVLAARLWQNHASALDGLARARSTWGVGLPRSWSIAATLSPRRRSGPLPSATTWCSARTGRSRSRPGAGNRLIWPSRCGTRRGSRRWCSCLFRKPRWSRTACTWTCGRLAWPMRRRWSG